VAPQTVSSVEQEWLQQFPAPLMSQIPEAQAALEMHCEPAARGPPPPLVPEELELLWVPVVVVPPQATPIVRARPPSQLSLAISNLLTRHAAIGDPY
jgi:hypothetical protein